MSHKRVDTFTSSGTWTCPAGITSVLVECVGAGGGGTTAVGGGGGGAFASSTLTVVPGNLYSVGVGTSASNTNGGDSTFDSTSVVAKGGLSGGNGGTGGLAASSTGTLTRNGGNGSLGAGNQAGGGGAGETQAGGNASGSTGGTGGSMVGGRGGATTLAGFLIGAGGGCAAASQASGARGEVRISYDETPLDGYPYVSARASTRGTGDTTSNPLTMPPGIVAGDLLICIFTSDEAPTHSLSGWTLLGQQSNALFTLSSSAWYKIAVGGDTITATTTNAQNSSAVILVVKNWGAVPTASASDGNSTNADPPNHSSPFSAKRLWIAGASWDWNTVINIAAMANYGDFQLLPGFNGTGVAIAIADRFLEAQAENPGAFTSGTEQWVAWTISVPGPLGNPHYYYMNQMAGQAA